MSQPPAEAVPLPHGVPPPDSAVSPEDLANLFAAMGAVGAMEPPAGPPRGRGALRRKILFASLIALIGVGASFASCVGQSFSLRQARALESIEVQLQGLRTDLAAYRHAEGR